MQLKRKLKKNKKCQEKFKRRYALSGLNFYLNDTFTMSTLRTLTSERETLKETTGHSHLF